MSLVCPASCSKRGERERTRSFIASRNALAKENLFPFLPRSSPSTSLCREGVRNSRATDWDGVRTPRPWELDVAPCCRCDVLLPTWNSRSSSKLTRREPGISLGDQMLEVVGLCREGE